MESPLSPAARVELVRFELLLPKPPRLHELHDHAARALYACPVCDARPGMVCWWSEPRAVRSWCAHASRRALVDAAALRRYRANPLAR